MLIIRPFPLRLMLDHRFVVSLGLSAVVGIIGLQRWPFPADVAVLSLIHTVSPDVYAAFAYLYATLWCTTPCLVFTVLGSLVHIFVSRVGPTVASRALPPYPDPARRQDLFLVLGEQHHRTNPEPASEPRWLTIPERGLYTGLAIVGAIGTGKTSACMYPYLEQLLAFKSRDPRRKLGALILEVKGDFCGHVQRILAQHGRASDYVEVSLSSTYRYNPLHNELDAYALAYGIATLMTNLFGRGKEPFWQQASTNLVKFVILLHQILDDYVTLFQVYEHIINPQKLRARIEEGERRFSAGNRRLVIDRRVHLSTTALSGWAWQEPAGHKAWTYFSPELKQVLQTAGIGFDVEPIAPPEIEAVKAAQFEAVKRWFEHDWMCIEHKLRSSIVEGISVFLSLFDDNPRVKHTFCPPKATFDPLENADGRHGIRCRRSPN